MRPLLPSVILACTLATGTLNACADDQDAEPTLPSVDFAPRLVILATDDGLRTEPGRDASRSVSPDDVPVGTVVEVRNASSEDHRITAGTTIDTGVLEPGDTTTVVMTTEGDLDVRDHLAGDTVSGDALTITVTARTGER